jgi:hypothetical protein
MAFGFSDAIDDDEAQRYPEYAQERDITPEPAPLDLSHFDDLMQSCSSLDDLNDECASIRKELSANDWAQHKAALSAMKSSHVERINAMTQTDFEDGPILFDDETGEVTDAE